MLAGAAAGYGGDRRRPVTGATVRGSSPRPEGSRPKDAAKAAAPQRRDPRVNPSRLRRVTLAALSLSAARTRSWLFNGQGRQARRAGGAPLKPFVEKVVTAPLTRAHARSGRPGLVPPGVPLVVASPRSCWATAIAALSVMGFMTRSPVVNARAESQSNNCLRVEAPSILSCSSSSFSLFLYLPLFRRLLWSAESAKVITITKRAIPPAIPNTDTSAFSGVDPETLLAAITIFLLASAVNELKCQCVFLSQSPETSQDECAP